MTTRLVLILALLGLMTPSAISSIAQSAGMGTIQGIVVREGTGEPIADVQIVLTGPPKGPAVDSQAILNALEAALGGLVGVIPQDLLQEAQESGLYGPPVQTVIADGEGRFTLRNVRDGEAVLRVQMKGFFGSQRNGGYPSIATVKAAVTANEISRVRVALIPGGTISGKVFDPSGKPLADARVQLSSVGYSNTALQLQDVELMKADDRGEYRFSRIPPGDYYVVASPQSQSLAAARAASGSNPQEAPVRTFHPNSADQRFAARITLRSGDDLAGVNVQMKTAPAVKVSGRVTGTVTVDRTPGRQGQARTAAVMLIPRESSSLLDLIDLGSTVAIGVEGGDFEFQGVTPGTYDIIARLPAAMGEGWGLYQPPQGAAASIAFGRATVEVRGSDVSGVSIVVRSGVDVKGRVLLDGRPVRANMRITLAPDDAFKNVLGDQNSTLVMTQIRQYAAPIAEDGSFVIPIIPEGRYRVQVNLSGPAAAAPARGAAARGARAATAATAPAAPAAPALPKEAYLEDIRLDSFSVYDNGLIVGTAELNPLTILLSTAKGVAEGTVVDKEQKPVSDATVVLVPPENRRQNGALYRLATSDAKGSYAFQNVPPGNYTVYAWESVLPGAYRNAEFLAQFAGRGKPVTVQVGPSIAAVVSVIPREGPAR